MNKLLLFVAAIGTATAISAAEAPDTFRQRYKIDSATAAENSKLAKAAATAAGKSDAKVVPFTVKALSEIKRLPSTFPADGEAFAPIDFIAAQGEYEAASIVLFPNADFDDVTVEFVGLPANLSIDTKVVKVWYQGGSAWYGFFADPLHRSQVPELLLHDENLIRTDTETGDYYVRYTNVDGKSRWAWLSARFEVTNYTFDGQANQELIIDATEPKPFVLNRNECKQLWFTLHATSDAKAGLYKATARIRSKGAEIAQLPVRVRVLPFTLPVARTRDDPAGRFYLSLYGANGNDTIVKNVVAHNGGGPLSTMLTPDPFFPELFKKSIQRARELGAVVDVGSSEGCGIADYSTTGNPNVQIQAKLENLRNVIAKTRAMYDKDAGHHNFFSYAIDEGGPSTVRAERQAWRIVHDAGGKIMVSTHPRGRLLFALDYMIMPGLPTPGRANQADLFHRVDPDNLVGWYANPHSGPENPDYFRRIHGMTAWQAGYDVASNYCWWRNNWNDFAVPYEPNLRSIIAVYGQHDGVLDTLAWEAMREGIDDIRYVTKMLQLADEALKSSNGDIQLLGRNARAWLAYWDGFRGDIAEFRAETIEYILKLQDALAKK